MHRSMLFLCVAAVATAIAGQWPRTTWAAGQSTPAAEETQRLQQVLDTASQRAKPGTLGVAVLDLRTGVTAGVLAQQPFPMMSVFKAPVAAAVLDRIEHGSMSLDQKVTVTQHDVSDGSAVPSVGAQFKAGKTVFTVERLLQGAVSESDNTAVNVLLRVAGGPPMVTTFLRAHGIDGMRVDVDEAGISDIFNDVKPGQVVSAQESDAAYGQRRQRGYQAFLADPRNRSTPSGAVAFLRKLQGGELLSPASTQYLLRLMAAQTLPNRLRAGVPQGVHLADKSGTSGTQQGRTAAYNDIGILSWPDGSVVIIAAFLSDSPASGKERDALFADLARSVATATRP
ncbi:MAG TPA: class A beta-lactamase [Dyella sp.]|uniref:class A beta-lactamase n=1 Tax=Dyella sp. TaxID=1869338 RepID=UPI002D78B9B6|nr:class A beta-lactamase [Dyella sp.]HET6554698.1 class A beta-lactamase [Dyella sp.]